MPSVTNFDVSIGEFNGVEELKSVKPTLESIPRYNLMDVKSVEELDVAMDRLQKAYMEFSTFTQAKVDQICEAAADHFVKHAEELAMMAHEETGMGNPAHKVAKNLFAVDYVRKWYRNTKTCGVISHDPVTNQDVVASPMGIVAAVIPTTNPTSTCGFKALCCLKTRNAIILAPHPRAKKCSTEAMRLIMEGAVAAGAPPDIACCISEPSIELTGLLMRHEKTSLVMATGGPGMVKAAYSSGHGAVGVGPGCVPVVVDEFANLLECATNVVGSKNFDNGVICSSEQVVVADESIYKDLRDEFVGAGAYFLNEDQRVKVADLLFKNGGALNADVVGQSPTKIAKMAGIEVPSTTTLLVGEFDDVKTSPFAKEKLSPVLGFTKRKGISELFDTAVDVLRLGGEGHTACYYTNKVTQCGRINRFANTVIVTRCLINQPSSPGGIGGIYNFGIAPSMTLGCGSYGGNYLSDNVGPNHLLNYKRISRCAEDQCIVMKNIDILVPPHIATRCAMELLILTLVIVAKNKSILEPFGELKVVYNYTKEFLEGKRDIVKLRECIKYFNDHHLYERGMDDLSLRAVAREFNMPLGNLYPILFPNVACRLENADWKACTGLDNELDTKEKVIQFVKKLHMTSDIPKTITQSSQKRIMREGVSVITDVVKSTGVY